MVFIFLFLSFFFSENKGVLRGKEISFLFNGSVFIEFFKYLFFLEFECVLDYGNVFVWYVVSCQLQQSLFS